MSEISPVVSNAIMAAVAVALYLLAWYGSRGRSVFEQVAIRLGLGLMVLVPVILAAGVGSYRSQFPNPSVATAPSKTRGLQPSTSSPTTAPGGTGDDAERARAAQQQADARRKQLESADARRSAAPSAGSTPPAEHGSALTPPADSAPAEAQPPPAPPSAPPIVPKATTEKWDVVPVYFGTDRNREPETKRASYGSDRGRRLELGRALVTVPKSHQVPNVERPWVYKLPFTSIVLYRGNENPSLHFTLQEVKSLTREELIALVRERLRTSSDYKDHAVVFVHGFNTSFDAALFRTAQISYDLKFDGAIFAYSWPSKGNLSLQDYSYDRESSGQAQPHLRKFLEFVVNETGAKAVSIIAHSMGNQLLLPVLRDLRRARPDGALVSQVILAAPDVDRDTFTFLANEINGVSQGITMLAASNDRALDVSRRFWGGVPRAGDIPVEGPVLISGMDTIDVTSVSTDVLAINHSGYAQKRALINDMRLLIQTGERPPEKRIPILQRISTPRGDYWRYPDSMR